MAIDNKDNKVLNVPHLRFPEFNHEFPLGIHLYQIFGFYIRSRYFTENFVEI